MKVDPSGIGWFDAVVVILLIVGIVQGKRHGMSNELLLLFQWLLIVVVCATYYSLLASLMVSVVPMPALLANVSAYLGIAVIIKLVFSIIKKMVGEKLVGSDIFGRLEFILGMIAGMTRYGCMVLFIMALANAPYITRQSVEEVQHQQEQEFGKAFFPTFGQIQQDIFAKSMTGKLVKNNLNHELISPLSHLPEKEKGPSISKRREAEVNDVINGGKK